MTIKTVITLNKLYTILLSKISHLVRFSMEPSQDLRSQAPELTFRNLIISFSLEQTSLSLLIPLHYLVGLGRLELPTPRLSSVCSNQLSYRPGVD